MNIKNKKLCRPVTFDKPLDTESLGKKTKGKVYCKVCHLEGRDNVQRNSAFCSNHGVALCQRVNIHPKNQTLFKIGATKD